MYYHFQCQCKGLIHFITFRPIYTPRFNGNIETEENRLRKKVIFLQCLEDSHAMMQNIMCVRKIDY